MQSFDIVIVGAGPAGLSLANALASMDLNICIVELQDEDALANPAFDGREIALTHRSIDLLKTLSIWSRIPAEEISRLIDARVRNGDSAQSLWFSHRDSAREELGMLVPNHHIRRAAWEALRAQSQQPTFLLGRRAESIERISAGYRISLDGDEQIECGFLVAADSRFSPSRRNLGIRARVQDFGKTMLVARVQHELPHGHVAQEWFQHGGTLALLPLNDRLCSVVVTRTAPEIETLMQMDAAAFAGEMEMLTRGELGAMTQASDRHAYPLVASWAENFAKPNAALIGDTAVGMHPVTAHGFNLGLRSVELLAEEIRRSSPAARPLHLQNSALQRYEWRLRRAALPLYTATNTLVRLYTDDRPAARYARDALLQLGEIVTPFRKLVARSLSAT